MADVPGSGVLSLLGIYNEVAEGNYSSGTSRTNVSLTGISDGSVDDLVGGNKTQPHAMSEFYSYAHSSDSPNAPGIVGYSAASTTTIEFTYSEVSSTDRVYVYLHDLNGDTSNQGAVLSIDDEGYQDSDGSGNTTITVPTGDTYYGDDDDELTIATNDYVTLKFKSRLGTGNYSAFSSTIQGWTLPTAPGAPTLGTATATTIDTSWSPPAGGASNYKVYMDAGDSTPTTLRTTQSGTSYTQTGLTSNTQYYFRLKSEGGGGDLSAAYGAVSNKYTAVGAPSSLQIDEYGTTTIDVEWTASPGGTPTLYQVKWGTNGVAFPNSGVTSDGSTTSFQLTSLTGNTQYYIKVRAYSTNGGANYSSYSNTLTQTTRDR